MANKRKNLSSDLAEALLNAVLDGHFPPNTALPNEAELAEMSGTSRLTVREAIQSLATKNVLSVQQGRGTFVNPPQDWSPYEPVLLIARAAHNGNQVQLPKQLIEARRVVEVAVAGFAAQRRSDEQLDAMETALRGMRKAHASDDVEAFVAFDIAFHDAVMTAAANPFLSSIFDPIRQILRLARRQTSAFYAEREHAIEQHAGIYTAVLAGDPKAARAAMNAHMDQTEEDFDTFVGEDSILFGTRAGDLAAQPDILNLRVGTPWGGSSDRQH
jgi:DNA-binding FadR family transcriptional regulator